MPLSLTQTTLVRIVAGQAITNNLLRLLALSPSVSISGSVATADLADGAVTPAKAAPGAYWYAADTTNTNAYAATFVPAVGSYANGLQLLLKVTNANTAAAAASLNANALGVKNIYHRNGQTPKAGDIPANSIVHLEYNSSLNSGSGGFEIVNVTASATIRPAANDTAGSATVQTVVNAPVMTAYQVGQLLLVKVGSGLTNTGALTLNCDGLGARNVLRPGGEALKAGDWLSAQTYLLYDDGTQFILLTKDRADAVVASCRNLVIQSASTTTATVAADEVVLKYGGAVASPTLTNGAPLLLSSVSLTIDITAGVALNGFETGGTRATSHWYYVWLISDGTNARAVLEDAGAGDGAVPAGPDLSNAAFTGYVYLGLVGQIRLNAMGSGEIVAFYQHDRKVWIHDTNIFDTGTAGASPTTYTVLAGGDLTNYRAAVPPNAVAFSGTFGSSSTADDGLVSMAACKSDGTADTTNFVGAQHIVLQQTGVEYENFACAAPVHIPVRGGASRNVQWKANNASNDARLNISGYTF